MDILKIAFIFMLSASFFGVAYSEEEAFKYNTNSKRDPFVPLIGGAASQSKELAYIESINDIRLEGIIWSPGSGSLVLLNGATLKQGDIVGVVTVNKIEKDKVVITVNEMDYTLTMVPDEEAK